MRDDGLYQEGALENKDEKIDLSEFKLVSILIPSFNHEEYISDCLESILDLTYPRIEVLISDDCSKDGTMEIINSYKERMEKRAERLIINQNQNNMGVCKNVNLIWKLAKGDYYKFIASDDILLPDSVSKLVDYMESHKICNFVHANAFAIEAGIHYPLQKADYTVLHSDKNMDGTNLTNRLLICNTIVAPSVMVSKQTKDKYGYYDEQLGFEDWEYWLRVSVGGTIGYLDEVVAGYRILENSLSRYGSEEYDKRKKYLFTVIKIFSRYSKFANKDICKQMLSHYWAEAYCLKDINLIKTVRYETKKCGVRIELKYRLKGYVMILGIYKIIPKNIQIQLRKIFEKI